MLKQILLLVHISILNSSNSVYENDVESLLNETQNPILRKEWETRNKEWVLLDSENLTPRDSDDSNTEKHQKLQHVQIRGSTADIDQSKLEEIVDEEIREYDKEQKRHEEFSNTDKIQPKRQNIILESEKETTEEKNEAEVERKGDTVITSDNRFKPEPMPPHLIVESQSEWTKDDIHWDYDFEHVNKDNIPPVYEGEGAESEPKFDGKIGQDIDDAVNRYNNRYNPRPVPDSAVNDDAETGVVDKKETIADEGTDSQTDSAVEKTSGEEKSDRYSEINRKKEKKPDNIHDSEDIAEPSNINGTKDKVTDDSTKDQVTDDSREDQVTDDSTKDQVTDDSTKDQVTDDSTEDQVTDDSTKDQVTDDSTKDQVTDDSIKDQVTDDSANDQVTDDSTDDQVTDDSANDQVTDDSTDDQVIDDSANDQVTDDSAKDQVTDDKTEDQVTDDSTEDQVNNDSIDSVSDEKIGEKDIQPMPDKEIERKGHEQPSNESEASQESDDGAGTEKQIINDGSSSPGEDSTASEGTKLDEERNRGPEIKRKMHRKPLPSNEGEGEEKDASQDSQKKAGSDKKNNSGPTPKDQGAAETGGEEKNRKAPEIKRKMHLKPEPVEKIKVIKNHDFGPVDSVINMDELGSNLVVEELPAGKNVMLKTPSGKEIKVKMPLFKSTAISSSSKSFTFHLSHGLFYNIQSWYLNIVKLEKNRFGRPTFSIEPVEFAANLKRYEENPDPTQAVTIAEFQPDKVPFTFTVGAGDSRYNFTNSKLESEQFYAVFLVGVVHFSGAKKFYVTTGWLEDAHSPDRAAYFQTKRGLGLVLPIAVLLCIIIIFSGIVLWLLWRGKKLRKKSFDTSYKFKRMESSGSLSNNYGLQKIKSKMPNMFKKSKKSKGKSKKRDHSNVPSTSAAGQQDYSFGQSYTDLRRHFTSDMELDETILSMADD